MRQKERMEPVCLACNYPLSQLDPATRACPECGRAFDPDDPWSMNTSRPVPEILRHWLAPVQWIWPAMRVVVIMALLCNILLAGGIIASWLVLCVLSAAVGGVYYFRKVMRHAVAVRYVLPPSLLGVDRAAISKSRRLFAVAAVLLFFRIPFYLVFLISLHWLNASGHYEYTVRPYFEKRPALTLIGVFPVREIKASYSGAYYDTWLGGMWYFEKDDGTYTWRFQNGLDPLHELPW